ncbi:MAG TPA: hypothetical protein PKH50_02780 [bacterium]|jgi:hypothetical protein|nr:hypothetical protein [bacterium]
MDKLRKYWASADRNYVGIDLEVLKIVYLIEYMKNLIKFFRFIFPCVLVVLFFEYSFAAVLTLQRIGALNTGGKSYADWWYTGPSPVLSGTAKAGENISIKIGEDSFSVTPDSSGNWSYATSLEKGDYPIQITQGEEKIAFTLHFGQSMPSGTTQSGSQPESTSSVPDTGFNQYVALTFGIGIILFATYLYFLTDSKKKSVFESRVLKEK